MYAVVQALRYWRLNNIFPKDFISYSDHQALKCLNSQKKRRDQHAEWAEFLQECILVLEHCAGMDNRPTDALRRVVGILHNMSVEVIGFEQLIRDYPSCSGFGK